MLSLIGRAAIRRVGGGASHQSTTNTVLQSLAYLQRVEDRPYTVESSFALRQFSSFLRSYATATATNSKTRTSTAANAKPKTKKAAPKKAAGKTLKTKPKSKKKVPATPKPKAKSIKKDLTDEQKAEAAKQKERASLKALKTAALTPPKGKPASPWSVIVAEAVTKENTGELVSQVKKAAVKYRSLTTEELEHYNHIANQNKAENEAAYKNWINSHKPDEIRQANNARKALKRIAPKHSHKYVLLQDPRMPKRSRRAHVLFSEDRWNSGDMKGMKLVDATRLIAKEWKELSDSQRKTYEDQEAAENIRYVQEYKTVFGQDPISLRAPRKAAS